MDPTLAFKFGIDTVLSCGDSLEALKRNRFALVAHPASVTTALVHSLDALAAAGALPHCVFGPQHGARGDKQDNMIETEDFVDPKYGIPVHSLYGAHRRPTEAMLSDVDLIVFDLQDVGCRVYTFLTTLHYLLEAAGQNDIPIWVLDRPNPAGRQIDGLALEYGEESFVGTAQIPMAHGLTLGEMAGWLNDTFKIGASLTVKKMEGYELGSWHQSAWPLSQPWVNPSPNASSVNMARLFSGTVLLEGTILSEGRGTTTPLEILGAPGLDVATLIETLRAMADLPWAAPCSDHASSSPLSTNTRERFVPDSSFTLSIQATSQSGTCLIRSWQSPFIRFVDNLARVFGALTSTNMSAADCPSMSLPADLDSVNG